MDRFPNEIGPGTPKVSRLANRGAKCASDLALRRSLRDN